MRKKFRIVKNNQGFTAEYNTRWMLKGEVYSNWEDSWMPVNVPRETLGESRHDLEAFKESINVSVVYEE